MIKLLKVAGAVAITAAVVMSVTGCGPHKHNWGEWQRDETEHSRVCLDCGEEQRGDHEDYFCRDCAVFKAVAFGYTENGDAAHADFAKEANKWFAEQAEEKHFIYDYTGNMDDLNEEFLSNYDLVMFLNVRPTDANQRKAFEDYMENGGAWLGFHSCAFAMNDAADEFCKQDWDWYHVNFLGSGEYKDNTWNPTSEILKVETHNHFSTENLPDTFKSAPNEWYSWEYDLRENPDITILLSLDESTYPAGDKPGEIWTEGYYPVAWTNNNYKMIYMNMGHNLVNYNPVYPSYTFGEEIQNTFVLDAMFGLTK